MAVVGRVARPHGLRGQVIVNPETDFTEDRFRPGAELFVRRQEAVQSLTVSAVRFHHGRPILTFDTVASIDEAEGLAGLELRVPTDALRPLPEGEFYRHDLVGCRVWTTAGAELGPVEAVRGSREVSHLVVRAEKGEVLVPLAADICVEIDAESRRILIEPPEGLLELNETGKQGGR